MTSTTETPKTFVFTGRHMLAILVAFFGVIISVNLLMAYYANSSWSGLISPNTYVASQEFNIKAQEAKKWMALGVTGELKMAGGEIHYTVSRPGGAMAVDTVKAWFRHPVGAHKDFSVDMVKAADGSFVGRHQVDTGEWIIELESFNAGKTVFHEAIRVHISGGKL